MFESLEEADVQHLAQAEANHGNDEDIEMGTENEVPAIGAEGSENR